MPKKSYIVRGHKNYFSIMEIWLFKSPFSRLSNEGSFTKADIGINWIVKV
jgi:hypothetical protein